MNEHLQPKRIFSYLFIVAIAVLFALQWGPGARGCDAPRTNQAADVAATVNGKEIPLKEFQRRYAAQLSQLRNGGSSMPESIARQLGFHTRVLDQLVNTELLAQAAEREGILPSDKEVREIIHKDPSFQKDGKFDFQLYQQVLRDYLRRTPQDYEAELRRQLAAEKLLDIVEGAAVVSEDEVKARFLKEGNVAKATFARFLPSMYTDKVPAPKAEELEGFAKQSEKEISDYYEANRFLYHQPERVKARHILIKVSREAPAEQQEAAKAKIENLRKEAQGGKDFAELAKQFSEDVGSKESGGDLGFNERGAWVPEFSDAAFALEPGQLSQPVQSQFGWHLIKVDEKKAPESKKLEDVRLEIARQLWNKAKAKTLAEAEAKKTLEALKAGKKLAELHPPGEDTQANAMRYQTETKPEAIESGEFHSGAESLPQLGAAPHVIKAVFARDTPGVLEELFPSGEGFAVVVVDERKKATDEEFAAKKESLKAEAIKAKQFELSDAYLKALKKSGNVVINDEAINAGSDVG